jgi:hypothetical protein
VPSPWPSRVLAVAAAAILFLHAVPGGGSDLALDLLCV